MIDMNATIAPKSDQLNADDLIGGKTRTITVTGVKLLSEEQPIAVHYEGDNGKPYKPCKSMRRVMVKLWGPDASLYVGRSMTLYCDDKVTFGALAVGGIRISHMSGLTDKVDMVLTASKTVRKAFRVLPLKDEESKPKRTQGQWLDDLEARLAECHDGDAIDEVINHTDTQRALKAFVNGMKTRLDAIIKAALDQTSGMDAS